MSDIFNRLLLRGYNNLMFGGNRDLTKVFGYPETVNFDTYFDFYKRNGLCKRIVTLPCEQAWKNPPQFIVKANPYTELDIMFKRLKMWARLEQLDRLSGIGRFGVLFMGVGAGGGKLSEPIEQGTIRQSAHLLYVKAYSEQNVSINTYEDKNTSERYGLPETYKIKMQAGKRGSSYKTYVVHWTRIIHVAENCDESDVFGTPRLEAVINRMYDLEKIVGGSAEVFWKNAVQRVAFDVDADAELTIDAKADMAEQIEELEHNLRSYIRTQGVTPHTFGGKHGNPKSTYDIAVAFISGTTGIPRRLLEGSERGELASSQDIKNYSSKISARQTRHINPNIFRQMFERFEYYGIIKNQEQIEIQWPSLYEMDEKLQAEIAKERAEALKFLSPLPVGDLITEEEARELLGFERKSSGEF